MVMEEPPEMLNEISRLVPPDTGDIDPVGVKQPNRPRGLSKEEEKRLKDRALALVGELAEADGSREMELADSITSLGTQAQRRAGNELELLRGRVGKMLSGDGSGKQIFDNLVDLRRTLNQINPDQVGAPGIVRRLVCLVPLVGNAAVKALERISVRYEPVSQQVSLIETRLREGRTMLARDNIELRMLYQQVEEQQLPIQRNAYLGELVMQHLGDLLERAEDPRKQERIRNVLSNVAVKVGDLRTMEAVHIEFFVSIEMTRQNNNRLGQSVERTLTLSSNVVHIGLAIRMALIRQERVLKANDATREFLGNLVEAVEPDPRGGQQGPSTKGTGFA